MELDELAAVGKELAAAYELARKTKPDTVGHRAAWARAERATQLLANLIGNVEPLKPTITAASVRLLRPEPVRQPQSMADREAKKHHSRMRS